MSINNQREYFDKNYKKWIRDISSREEEIIIQSFNNLGISGGDAILDVGCGTGVLYDYIIIYNSIPHFDQLENVFCNARHLLEKDGVFSIIHARSREGLREHHKKIGYTHNGDPIPSNETLMRLCEDYGLKNVKIKDDQYFYFSCSK